MMWHSDIDAPSPYRRMQIAATSRLHAPLLFYTSNVFLINIYFGVIYAIFEWSLICLVSYVSSLLYHATGRPIIRTIDMIIINGAVMYGIWWGRGDHWEYSLAVFIFMTMATMYWILRKSDHARYGELYHAFLHVIGNVGIYLLGAGVYRTSVDNICRRPTPSLSCRRSPPHIV